MTFEYNGNYKNIPYKITKVLKIRKNNTQIEKWKHKISIITIICLNIPRIYRWTHHSNDFSIQFILLHS